VVEVDPVVVVGDAEVVDEAAVVVEVTPLPSPQAPNTARAMVPFPSRARNSRRLMRMNSVIGTS
jgi:hypothetical protein